MVKKNKINNHLGRDFKKERENDKISTQRRSLLMSKIRSTGTKFEKDFVCLLSKKMKKRFALNVRLIKGKPDIVFKRHKVFPNGNN